MTHTPSPWTTGRAYSSTGATPIRWKGENLAWVCGLDSAHEFSREQAAANARLIAAAPALLEALKAVVIQDDWEGEDVDPQSPIGKAYAAITLATGQES